MGLDMSLYKRKLFGHSRSVGDLRIYDSRRIENARPDKWISSWECEELAKEADEEDLESIEIEIAYWRKFNALHHWFVENCAEGVDECQEIYVSFEQMRELKDILVKLKDNLELVDGKIWQSTVLKADGSLQGEYVDGKVVKDSKLAEKLLPTCMGPFFGSLDYDEFYYNQVCKTLEVINEHISTADDWDFYYEANW